MWPSERHRPTRAPRRWVCGLGVGARLGWSVSRDSGIVPPVVWEPLPGCRSRCGGLGALLAGGPDAVAPLVACDLGELLFTATERVHRRIHTCHRRVVSSGLTLGRSGIPSRRGRAPVASPGPGALLGAGPSANRLRSWVGGWAADGWVWVSPGG